MNICVSILKTYIFIYIYYQIVFISPDRGGIILQNAQNSTWIYIFICFLPAL